MLQQAPTIGCLLETEEGMSRQHPYLSLVYITATNLIQIILVTPQKFFQK